MFNAEMMLGKMLSGVMDSGSGRHGIGSSLASQLTSGTGLLTMIGLGVGAYEILKNQGNAQAGTAQIPPAPPPSPGPSMPPPVGGPAMPPPPPTPQYQAPPTPLPATAPGPDAPPVPAEVGRIAAAPEELDGPALAFRMIQAMIASAHADGVLDAEEEGKILEKLMNQGLTREEKQVLLHELHHPQTIEQLVRGITDPRTAQMMYSIAAMAIEIDTDAERQWLDRLAQALKISPNMQRFLENMSEE